MSKILLFLNLFCFVTVFSQTESYIDINIKDAKDLTLILGHHYGNQNIIIDTLKLDKKGKVVFSSNKRLKEGVYFLLFKNKDYIEFLVSTQQTISINMDYTELQTSLEVTGNKDSELFNEYQKNNYVLYNKSKQIQEQSKDEKNPDRIDYLKREVKEIDNEIRVSKKELINNYPNTLTAKIVKASLNPERPSFNSSLDYNNPKEMKKMITHFYQYHIYHYFDNIDFTDERILYTPIYYAKIERFFSTMISQNADSIMPQVKKLLIKAEMNDEIYKYTLSFLFEYYLKKKKYDFDRVVVFIAENYILNSNETLFDKDFTNKVSERVNLLKSTMLAAKSPNIYLNSENGDTLSLYSVDAEFTIIYFWDIECGYCRSLTPELHKLFKDFTTLKVFAVYTGSDFSKWKEEIEKNNLDWINVCDFHNTSNYYKSYNIYSLPTLYLLSSDKEIISQDQNLEHLRSLLYKITK